MCSSDLTTVTLPDGTTRTITATSIINGAVTTTSIAYFVPTGATTAQTFTGQVSSTTTDPKPANNATSTAAPLTPTADLAIAITIPTNATPGQTVTAVVTITNNGPSTANNVTTTVTLPDGTTRTITATAIINGQVTTTTIAYLVPTGATTAQTFTGVVSSTTTDPVAANNTTATAAPLTPVADLAVLITVPANATPGSVITVTVVITNAGPSTANAVTATVTLPDGTTRTITATSIVSGGTSTTIVSYTVPAGSVTTQTFTGQVASTTPDPTPGNNSTTAQVGVRGNADVTTLITVPVNTSVSVVVTGTVSFVNIGSATAQGVSGTVTLPAGVVVNSIPVGAVTTTVAGLPVIVFPATLTGLGSVNAGVTTSFAFTFRTPVVTGTYVVTSTVATTTPENVTANNRAVAPFALATPVTSASLSGRVYIDVLRNKVFNAGTDTPLANFRAEVVRVVGTTTIVYGSAITNANGEYSIPNLPVGGGFTVRFFDNGGSTVFGAPFNTSPVRNGQQVSLLGNPSTGSNTVTGPVVINQATPFGASINDVTLYADDNVTEQNLPLDPSGIVYNSVTRQPVKGATVKIVFEGTGSFSPANQILGGSDTVITGDNGLYQFWFVNNPPAGVYRFDVTQPAGFLPPEASQGGVIASQGTLTAQAGDTRVQPQSIAPPVGVNGGTTFTGLNGPTGTQYFLRINLNLPSGVQVFNNHIPLDPILAAGSVLVTKTGDRTVAEIGDSVRYTIQVRNTTAAPIAKVKLSDLLPAGFRYVLGTSRLDGVAVSNPAGGVGRELTYDLGSIAAKGMIELTYFARLGVGSQQGDGVNRAQVTAPVVSNVALHKVTVQGGVFSNDGCIIGKVYVDCDGNAIQSNAGGSRELGIPGVRLVMLDGTFVLTDSEGKYSICGLKSQTHVVKIDRTTLPRGSRMVPSSNRNAGVGDSLFVDLKGGELSRADFIEGSCSVEVLDQVKARRAQGAVVSPEVEKNLPLKIENRPADTIQQILPEARQQGNSVAKPVEAR